MLLSQSLAAFDLLTAAGAAYLLFLGVGSLHSAFRSQPLVFEAQPLRDRGRGFRDGFWVNVLNPKVSLFYLALVPQFVDEGNGVVATYAVLTGIHVAFGALWFTVLSLVLARIRPWLLSVAARRVIDLAAGLIMIGIAVRVAMQS
jgi:threonine/homoserine/homoserine lactone efflux protein